MSSVVDRPDQGSSGVSFPRSALVAVLLLFAQIAVLAAFGHSPAVAVWSDLFQLASSICAATICLLTSRRSHGIARPFWYLTSAAFASWSLGKSFLLYDFYFLKIETVRIVPLLLFFLAAAPMFVTVFLSAESFREEISWEWILDASQILGLILVVYLFLIYIPLLYYGEAVVNPLEDRLLLWRNILLAACLLVRALISRSPRVRRLYLPVGLIMALFAASTWFGNRAQAVSDAPEMSWYDLAWSVPFCLISLSAAFWRESPEPADLPAPTSGISRVILAYLPSLFLPVMLLAKYRSVVREQIVLALFGLMFSIILFNARLVLTQRRQGLTASALQATEQQYRSLFERNMAGVFRATIDGKLLDCNPAFASMFGYTRAELLRIPLYDLYFGGAQERSQWLLQLQTGNPSPPREFCLRRKDGLPIWVLVSVNLEVQADHGVLEGTLVDVTERRALETQLRQAQKMEAIGRLAAGVAHDFNNLLTIISGYSSIQLERSAPDDPVHHEAAQIRAASDRAAALTRQLLAFSRQQVLQPRAVNLNDIVRSIDKMLRRLIGEDIDVRSTLADDLGTVKVDPGQIDQVLMNLVVNARDAMPNGGTISIQTQNVQLDDNYARNHDYVNPGHYVMLAVSDGGTGITPENQARMFEPFFTTKEPGKGTGLGLPMVYGIVKQSGGSIEVYSELNHGTTVKLYLPRIEGPVEAAPTPVRGTVNATGAERILLVEDDSSLRQLATDILRANGYSVHTIEKIEDLENSLPRIAKCDLLLTDVVMPTLNGPDLAARVTRHWPGIKVLYMSGYTPDAIVHHGVLEKGIFFLPKPFMPAALAAKVREVLDTPAQPTSR